MTGQQAYPSPEDAVKRMLRYIEEHLKEPVTAYQLARAAGYSPCHSARLFKEATGLTPFAYLRRLRLAQSTLMLRGGRARVIDVALDFEFDSHEGFTRAFAKEFGITPKRSALHPVPLPLFDPRAVREHTDRQEEETMTASFIFVQIMDRPARKLILKRGVKATHYFEYCEEVGCDAHDTLSEIQGALYEPMGLWLPEKLRPEGTSEYVSGVEVPMDYVGAVPPGFEVIELPPCQMLIFQGEPFEDEQYAEAIGALWSRLHSFNPEVYGYEWAPEIAPRFQLAPMGYRGYIEGRPVRKINRD